MQEEKNAKEKAAAAAKALADLEAAKKLEQNAALDASIKLSKENLLLKAKIQETEEKHSVLSTKFEKIVSVLGNLKEKSLDAREAMKDLVEPVVKEEENKIPSSGLPVSELVKQQKDLDDGIQDLKKILEHRGPAILELGEQIEKTRQFTITAIEEVKKAEDVKMEVEAARLKEAEEIRKKAAEISRAKEIDEIKENAGATSLKVEDLSKKVEKVEELSNKLDDVAEKVRKFFDELKKKVSVTMFNVLKYSCIVAVVVLLLVSAINSFFTASNAITVNAWEEKHTKLSAEVDLNSRDLGLMKSKDKDAEEFAQLQKKIKEEAEAKNTSVEEDATPEQLALIDKLNEDVASDEQKEKIEKLKEELNSINSEE